jgi:Tol biopolymer transport system component
LVWVDRTGKVETLPTPIRNYYGGPVLSPDGQRVAVTVTSGTDEIWIYDLAGGSFSRLPSEAGGSRQVLWTPDGKRLTYQGNRGGYRNLFWRAADGTGPEEQLTMGEEAEFPSSWSPDGKVLAFWRASLTTAQDIWLLSVEGDRKPQPFLQSPFSENWSGFSPDGRWLAYQSDESGRYEVYVRSFPGPGGKWQISTDGAIGTPLWAASGRELFYPNGNKWMVVDVQTQPTFRPGRPRVLFEVNYEIGDVTRDGQQFLAVQPVEPEQPATQIHVVLNWSEELKKRVPAGQGPVTSDK